MFIRKDKNRTYKGGIIEDKIIVAILGLQYKRWFESNKRDHMYLQLRDKFYEEIRTYEKRDDVFGAITENTFKHCLEASLLYLTQGNTTSALVNEQGEAIVEYNQDIVASLIAMCVIRDLGIEAIGQMGESSYFRYIQIQTQYTGVMLNIIQSMFGA